MIYIDPPYNTGNEGWAYNDNVNSPLMRQWLGKVVDRDDLERHDKWLCMMWPRVSLLRELLANDGVMFASIDETEIANLYALCDELFGPEKSLRYDHLEEALWRRSEGKISREPARVHRSLCQR